MPITPQEGSVTDPWLSQMESADYLGVTDRTVRKYVSRGVLPASRIAGSRLIRIRKSDLDKMLNPLLAEER